MCACRGGAEKGPQAGSVLSAQSWLTTLGSWPEPKSRVGHSTHWPTQVPLPLLFFISLTFYSVSWEFFFIIYWWTDFEDFIFRYCLYSMWGSNSEPRDWGLHALLTEPARCPLSLSFKSCTEFFISAISKVLFGFLSVFFYSAFLFVCFLIYCLLFSKAIQDYICQVFFILAVFSLVFIFFWYSLWPLPFILKLCLPVWWWLSSPQEWSLTARGLHWRMIWLDC